MDQKIKALDAYTSVLLYLVVYLLSNTIALNINVIGLKESNKNAYKLIAKQHQINDNQEEINKMNLTLIADLAGVDLSLYTKGKK